MDHQRVGSLLSHPLFQAPTGEGVQALGDTKVLLSPSCYTMTQVAKSLSMTVLELTKRLMDQRIIYRSASGPMMLYADYLKNGYEAYRTSHGEDADGNVLWTDSYLVWTEKGKEFVRRMMENEI